MGNVCRYKALAVGMWYENAVRCGFNFRFPFVSCKYCFHGRDACRLYSFFFFPPPPLHWSRPRATWFECADTRYWPKIGRHAFLKCAYMMNIIPSAWNIAGVEHDILDLLQVPEEKPAKQFAQVQLQCSVISTFIDRHFCVTNIFLLCASASHRKYLGLRHPEE